MATHTAADQFAQHRARALADLPLMARDRELKKILGLLTSNTPVLICGTPGLGKTRLLLEIQRYLAADGTDAVYCRFKQPLHAFLLEIADQLSITISNPSSVNLRGVLWNAFELKPRVILLDDIADATPHFYRFFERILAAKGNRLIASAAHAYAIGSLHRILWNQQATISLQHLSRRDATALVESVMSIFLTDRSLANDFADRVIHVARGNPGRIVEMCIRAADPAYRATDDHIRFGALVMDSFTGMLP